MQIVGSYCLKIISSGDMYHEKLFNIANGDLFANLGNHCIA
jgi:hypothetical protein